MNVLLTGSSGFIGSHLARALRAAEHVVVEAHRDVDAGTAAVQADFTRDLSAREWMPKLAGIDAVINAVGILREHGVHTYERIHKRAPQALFTACVAAGVRRVVQISALGADRGTTRYFLSKRAADDYLATLPLDWTIVRPAIVYGTGGASARLFTMLASMPLVPLPGRGEQLVQPIYIDDFVAAVVRLLSDEACHRTRVELVGPQPLTLRELLTDLRSGMGLGRPHFLPVPLPLMLEASTTADPTATSQLIGRPPRPAAKFIDSQARSATLTAARLMWLLPLMRISIAMVWILTVVIVGYTVITAWRQPELLMSYVLVKWTHILSSTLLFGTGLGSAFYMFFASRTRDPRVVATVVRYVVIADWAFTTPAVILQPLTGIYLVRLAGFPFDAVWIGLSIALYLLAGACWLPVVWMQIKMREMANEAVRTDGALPEKYWSHLRVWVALGVIAFLSLVAVFYLMVAKPT